MVVHFKNRVQLRYLGDGHINLEKYIKVFVPGKKLDCTDLNKNTVTLAEWCGISETLNSLKVIQDQAFVIRSLLDFSCSKGIDLYQKSYVGSLANRTDFGLRF